MIRGFKNTIHKANAVAAALFYGFPGRRMTIIGVTGTDGKTTTSHMIYHLLRSCGKKVSLVSTIRAIINDVEIDTGFHVTTPTAWKLQSYMKAAALGGSEYFVLEVTSHGLDQGRVLGASIDIGVITNITHEHLDYHGTFEKYRDAKAKILKGVKVSILNKDDDNYAFLEKKARGKIRSFSLNKDADITPEFMTGVPKALGEFNKANALAAAAAASEVGVDRQCINTSIRSFTGIPGRMEIIKTKTPFHIMIDFAHKPNALRHALLAARELTRGKLIVVFGCAGLRDKLKRPMMGAIAEELADYAIFTAEDPRTEDVRDITNQIVSGLTGKMKEASKGDSVVRKQAKQKYFWRIPDRQEAINFAIRKLAVNGDFVLLCGKGHEQSMCWGSTEYPWDEKAAVHKALYGTVNTSIAVS